MSSYEPEKDKEIAKEVLETGAYKLVVSLFSYDNGPVKMQLGRININEGKEQFAKLGRLTKSDLLQVMPLIEKLIPKMDNLGESQETIGGKDE